MGSRLQEFGGKETIPQTNGEESRAQCRFTYTYYHPIMLPFPIVRDMLCLASICAMIDTLAPGFPDLEYAVVDSSQFLKNPPPNKVTTCCSCSSLEHVP